MHDMSGGAGGGPEGGSGGGAEGGAGGGPEADAGDAIGDIAGDAEDAVSGAVEGISSAASEAASAASAAASAAVSGATEAGLETAGAIADAAAPETFGLSALLGLVLEGTGLGIGGASTLAGIVGSDDASNAQETATATAQKAEQAAQRLPADVAGRFATSQNSAVQRILGN